MKSFFLFLSLVVSTQVFATGNCDLSGIHELEEKIEAQILRDYFMDEEIASMRFTIHSSKMIVLMSCLAVDWTDNLTKEQLISLKSYIPRRAVGINARISDEISAAEAAGDVVLAAELSVKLENLKLGNAYLLEKIESLLLTK